MKNILLFSIIFSLFTTTISAQFPMGGGGFGGGGSRKNDQSAIEWKLMQCNRDY